MMMDVAEKLGFEKWWGILLIIPIFKTIIPFAQVISICCDFTFPSSNFLGFTKRFPDEQSCRDFLFERRWPNGFACPECGSVKAYFIRTRELFECRDCKHQTSLTAGTAMEKTRTPLKAWFWMIFLMANCKTGVRAGSGAPHRNHLQTGVVHGSEDTAGERDEQYLLEGIVELDESYFGGKRKPGKRGRGAAGKVPVLVGVTVKGPGPGVASMRVLDSVTAAELKRPPKR